MPRNWREICSHCNKELHYRTVRRHLKKAGINRPSNPKGRNLENQNAGDPTLNLPAILSELDELDIGEDEGANGEGVLDNPAGNNDAGGALDPHEIFNNPTQIRRNPPVTIEDWPEPGDEDPDDSEVDQTIPADSPDQDPPFVERTEPPTLHPDQEGEFDDQELRELLELHHGTLDEGEWIDLYERLMGRKDLNTFRLLAARLRTHFSRETYEDLRQGICEDLGIPSEFIAWRRLRIMSGLETRAYDCCINSCCCFLGKYKDLTSCPYCKESRFNSSGKPRRVFRYSPLIPQLRALFQNVDMVKKLRYRVEIEDEHMPDVIQDVFDGAHYRSLRTKQVTPTSPYCFFDNPEDIALSLSTDGFTLFKRRRRGLSTAWPIILINNNLSPKIRTRLDNVICVGVIPGPRQCKDLNSFLIPLLDELLELEQGVEHTGLSTEGERYIFSLRAFLIHIFGDIPAVSKLLFLKGHNAFSPCRTCYIEGCLFRYPRVSVYYVPLTHPNLEAKWDCDDLPMRTHEGFLAHAAELDAARTKTARDKLSRHYGINARPVFSFLKSFDLASCAPYDIMHLLFENTVPNMLLHWTGKFKGLDQGTGNYELLPALFILIGQETAACLRYIPSSYVGMLPDIAQDGHLYKAEAYSFWIQYLAPILLKDRLPNRYYKHMLLLREIYLAPILLKDWLPNRYYKHMLLLREIVIMCLEFKLTSDDLDHLNDLVKLWVTGYEK
ncbi:hypothetical protein RSAG8_12061, partial [Rhizoctonia solani AG-8 WAC10335]